MSDGIELLWGLVMVGCGVFISVYGSVLFRFVLAMIGFTIGFAGAFIVTSDQNDALRILVGIVAGGLVALLLYSLIKIGLYIAGGILGAVVALVLSGLLGFLDSGFGWSALVLLVAGTGSIGFFGRRLGNWIIILATAAAGSFMIVYGISLLYLDTFETDVEDPSLSFSKSLPFVLFLVVAAVGGLGQYVSSNLRTRIRT